MSKNKMSGHKNANDSAYLKHLEFIQAIVARMTQSSVQTKSLLLPVVVATYGYALTQKSVSVSLLGIAAVLLLAISTPAICGKNKPTGGSIMLLLRGQKKSHCSPLIHAV